MFERLSSQPAGRRRCLCHTPSHSVTLHHPLVTHSPFPWLLSPVVCLKAPIINIFSENIEALISLLEKQSMKYTLWGLFVQGGSGLCPLFEYQIYYSSQQPPRKSSRDAHWPTSCRPFKKRTKESWTENGCLCVFFVIWITEYASRGIRRSAWYFFRDLGSFPLLSSCNRMRKVIICLM